MNRKSFEWYKTEYDRLAQLILDIRMKAAEHGKISYGMIIELVEKSEKANHD